jgi:plasmid stability protein
MALQTVTLKVSDEMYRRLQRRAEQAHRSIEDEVLDLVAFAMPVDDELPATLLEALAPLPTLDDAALWRVARSRLPIDVSVELEELHLKRQREGLTAAEAERAEELVGHYDRTMLLRAEAALLLKQRGYDVAELAAPA